MIFKLKIACHMIARVGEVYGLWLYTVPHFPIWTRGNEVENSDELLNYLLSKSGAFVVFDRMVLVCDLLDLTHLYLQPCIKERQAHLDAQSLARSEPISSSRPKLTETTSFCKPVRRPSFITWQELDQTNRC